jgi:hypothetical protein
LIDKNYSFSFTACSLRETETLKIASLYANLDNWTQVRTKVMADNLLQQKTESSLKRLYNELSSGELCLHIR